MANYRRNFVAGASYFFTVNLADRQSKLLIEHIDLLREAFRYTRNRHPFEIDAIVVLPEHLHTIWTLPPEDKDYAKRWRLIKTQFSRGIPKGERVSHSRRGKAERGIWQRRYWEHTLRDELDYARHADYIYFNPVKHGHVDSVPEWPYSSFHREVDLGVHPVDWAGGSEIDAGFGEA